MIYFIRRPDGYIKIGTTTRLSQRLKAIRCEHGDCKVLAVMDGSYADESALHAQFHGLRVEGEWFSDAEELLGFIAVEGRPWDGADEIEMPASTKMDAEVVDDCRIAAAFCGMSLAEYLSERMRVAARKDIDDGYARRASGSQPPKGKGGKH